MIYFSILFGMTFIEMCGLPGHVGNRPSDHKTQDKLLVLCLVFNLHAHRSLNMSYTYNMHL